MGALTLPGVDVSMPSSVARDMSQWFTPAPLAERLVDWMGLPKKATVIEPSAGNGAIVRALMRNPSRVSRVDAVELDASHMRTLEDIGHRGAVSVRLSVECADYLTRPAPAERYNFGVANPPYENDLDAKFAAKLMDECDRVVILVRAVFFNGLGRYERVWSRVDADEWRICGVAHLVRRPSFLLGGVEQGGAQADFVAIKMMRASNPGGPCAPVLKPEWWQ